MNVEIEFLEWVHPSFGVMPAKVEGDKPLVLKAKINMPKREWVGLTDEECAEIVGNPADIGGCMRLCQTIEAKLKERNQ